MYQNKRNFYLALLLPVYISTGLCLQNWVKQSHPLSVLQAHSRLAGVLATLQMSSAVVVALETLQEVCKTQKLPDTFKTASRLSEARNNERRKQPTHQYHLLGVLQSCAVEEVSAMLTMLLEGWLINSEHKHNTRQ